MEANLPATEGADLSIPAVAPAPPAQPVSVAFLPLALAAFLVIAFVLAAWAFFAAAGA